MVSSFEVATGAALGAGEGASCIGSTLTVAEECSGSGVGRGTPEAAIPSMAEDAAAADSVVNGASPLPSRDFEAISTVLHVESRKSVKGQSAIRSFRTSSKLLGLASIGSGRMTASSAASATSRPVLRALRPSRAVAAALKLGVVLGRAAQVDRGRGAQSRGRARGSWAERRPSINFGSVDGRAHDNGILGAQLARRRTSSVKDAQCLSEGGNAFQTMSP